MTNNLMTKSKICCLLLWWLISIKKSDTRRVKNTCNKCIYIIIIYIYIYIYIYIRVYINLFNTLTYVLQAVYDA